jgi:hypothetical protein
MNPLRLLAVLTLATPLAALAQGSLGERRLAITHGTSTGTPVLVLPAKAAASAPATAASAPATAAPARTGLFSRLPPPSGRPLSAAQRLDAPDQGIVIKPAAPASAAR